MANNELGKRLTRHFYELGSKSATALRELQVNKELYTSIRDDDIPIMVAKVDEAAKNLMAMRVVLKSMESKAHYGAENSQTVTKLIESISADSEMIGTELNRFADFSRILDERPMVATALLAFLVKDFNKLFRAVALLSESEREVIARALKESIKK